MCQALHLLVELETLPKGSRGHLRYLETLTKSAIPFIRIEALESASQIMFRLISDRDVRPERWRICHRSIEADLPKKGQIDGRLAVAIQRGLELETVVEGVRTNREKMVSGCRGICARNYPLLVSYILSFELMDDLAESSDGQQRLDWVGNGESALGIVVYAEPKLHVRLDLADAVQHLLMPVILEDVVRNTEAGE